LQGVGSATNGRRFATEVDLSLPRAFQAAVEEGLLPKMPPEVLKHREAAICDFQLWMCVAEEKACTFFDVYAAIYAKRKWRGQETSI